MLSRVFKQLNKPYKNRYLKRCFSQEGEDIVLAELAGYGKVGHGFYVDVGAHHPWRFSNTAIFYLRGWRGMNIDANPGSKKLFDNQRRSDTNIEAAVGESEGEQTYFIYNDAALNGIDRDRRVELAGTGCKLLRTTVVTTVRLETLLDQHIEELPSANFLSVDVEGYDLQVLRSNNWERYPFAWVLAEAEGKKVEPILKSETCRYLESLGYVLRATTGRTAIFARGDKA
jgi:FkbM family methyltransferase